MEKKKERGSEKKNQDEPVRIAERFALAVKGVDDGIWEIDVQNKEFFITHRCKEQIGYRDHELTNTFETLMSLMHPEDRDGVNGYFREYLKGGVGRFEVEYRLRHRDGRYRWFRSRGESARDSRGIPSRIVAFQTDITREKTAYLDLERTNRRLKRAIERANDLAIKAQVASITKSEFLANMSHEIRTPMNGVIGMIDLLLDTELNDVQRRYVDIMRGSGKMLLDLINDILDYSKIEAQRLQLEKVNFNLPELVSEVCDTLRVKAQEKGLRFSREISAELPRILYGDSRRLRQILGNLLGNAVKFTQQGTVALIVGARTTGSASDQLILSCTIRDSGIGIAEEDKVRLFEKFRQLDASTTRKYGGTGLGLAISKQLAGLMGGDITVRSPIYPGGSGPGGPGSEFLLTLPLEIPGRIDHPEEVEAGQVQPVVSIEEARKKLSARNPLILLAEDNVTNREVALGILGKLGLGADLVDNGQQVLTVLREKAYDLVLMDIQMPVMDGFETARRIRLLEEEARVNGWSGPPLPVIAVTAYAMQGDRELCLEAGMSDYLMKPISIPAMAGILLRWVGEDKRDPLPYPVWDREAMMGRLMADDALLVKIVAGFLMDMPRQMEILAILLDRGDAIGIARQMHNIKGAVVSVSGESMQRTATRMEEAAMAGDLQLVRGFLPVLEAEFGRLRKMMDREIKNSDYSSRSTSQ